MATTSSLVSTSHTCHITAGGVRGLRHVTGESPLLELVGLSPGTYPVGRENDELIACGEPAVGDLRDGDDPVLLQLEVPEGPSHGEPRVVVVGEPHPRYVGLVPEGEDPAVVPLDPLGLICNGLASVRSAVLQMIRYLNQRDSKGELTWETGLQVCGERDDQEVTFLGEGAQDRPRIPQVGDYQVLAL